MAPIECSIKFRSSCYSGFNAWNGLEALFNLVIELVSSAATYHETWDRWTSWGQSAAFCSLKSFSFGTPLHRTVLRSCLGAMHAVYAWWSYCLIHRPCSSIDWGLGAEVSYIGWEIYRIYPCLRQSWIAVSRKHWGASANCSLVLFLLSVKNEGFHVTTSRYIWRTVTAWWLEVVLKIIRWCGDKTFGGVRCCRIYECSVGSGQSLVPALRLLFRWLQWP